MLRALGFGRSAILLALLLEGLLLSLVACATGLAACAASLSVSSLFQGTRQDYLSDTTWTVMAYELRITPAIVVAAFGVAALVGGIGTLAPAVRASRINVLEALRKA